VSDKKKSGGAFAAAQRLGRTHIPPNSTPPHATPEKRSQAENIKNEARPKVKQTTTQKPQQKSSEAFFSLPLRFLPSAGKTFRSGARRSNVLKDNSSRHAFAARGCGSGTKLVIRQSTIREL